MLCWPAQTPSNFATASNHFNYKDTSPIIAFILFEDKIKLLILICKRNHRILACMHAVKFRRIELDLNIWRSIELDLHMYLADGHFLFIHFLSIDTSSQNLVAATTSSQH
jgi:hypothetical protein